MSTTAFDQLGLSPELLQAIASLGYEQPAPVQAAAIPLILAGKDIMGQSQTGSGKTAAFALPAIEACVPSQRVVQTLVLCPTRELAVQVAEEFHKLSAFKKGIRCVPVYGGQSYDRQLRGLQLGAQIVIGTPGRVLDHIERGTLRLDSLRQVVLDEADRMLDMGFREDIAKVLDTAPKGRQLICFSATMAKPILDLIHSYSKELETVRIHHKTLAVPEIEQTYYEVPFRSKTDLLTRLIDFHDIGLGLIFCNTKRLVDELTDELIARGYSADRIHGDITQAQRERVMGAFRSSRIEFLVATDVAARGLDVEGIEVVFNYELPWDEEDYVHRIGRTGRAGRSGKAISLISGREIYKLQHIERFTKARVRRMRPPSEEEVEERRSSALFEKIKLALAKEDWKSESPMVERLLEQGFSSTDIACAALRELKLANDGPPKPPAPEPQPRQQEMDRGDRPERPQHRSSSSSRPPSRYPREAGKTFPPRHATTKKADSYETHPQKKKKFKPFAKRKKFA